VAAETNSMGIGFPSHSKPGYKLNQKKKNKDLDIKEEEQK
jgi:hypothetical protein